MAENTTGPNVSTDSLSSLSPNDRQTLEKLSSIYDRHFNKPTLDDTEYRVEQEEQKEERPDVVKRTVNFLLEIYGPRCLEHLDRVTAISTDLGQPRTALFLVCAGLAVFRRALEWSTVSASAKAIVERRRRKEDEVAVFLDAFIHLVDHLNAMQLSYVEIQLFHALMALSPQGEVQGCSSRDGGCKCPAEMTFSCADIRTTAIRFLVWVYGEGKRAECERLFQLVITVGEMAVRYGSRYFRLPLPQPPQCNLHHPLVSQQDVHFLSVLFLDDDP